MSSRRVMRASPPLRPPGAPLRPTPWRWRSGPGLPATRHPARQRRPGRGPSGWRYVAAQRGGQTSAPLSSPPTGHARLARQGDRRGPVPPSPRRVRPGHGSGPSSRIEVFWRCGPAIRVIRPPRDVGRHCLGKRVAVSALFRDHPILSQRRDAGDGQAEESGEVLCADGVGESGSVHEVILVDNRSHFENLRSDSNVGLRAPRDSRAGGRTQS